MSIQKIIQEAINKNPHDLKEALEEELRDRIRLALEAKMSDEEDDDSSEEDDDSSDEDDDDDDEEDMKKESVEQIDELDRKTLASYVKKAVGVGHRNTLPLAMRDKMTAADMGDKEWYKQSTRYVNNRAKGIERAADRLAKESVEQIDEISASTLGSYIRKGTKDIEKSYDAREKARDVEDSKTARAMGLRARKREKGVSDAISKLTGHYTAKVHAGDK